ncbi:MAG: Flagellar export chaperone FlgN, partial [Bacteroidota bacterium]|nr:Flagellar export chaperone FlgN [Bacteroidota bacterium]
RQAEEQRINMITNWLKISRREAAELRLSYLERIIDRHNAGLIENIKNEMKAMFKSLKEINTTNRVLANRARRTVSHILSSFTNGRNQVCNVKI